MSGQEPIAAYYNEKFALIFYADKAVFAVIEELLPTDSELKSFYKDIYGRFDNELAESFISKTQKRNKMSLKLDGKTFCQVVAIDLDPYDSSFLKLSLTFLNFMLDYWESGRYIKFEPYNCLKVRQYCDSLQKALLAVSLKDLTIKGFKLDSFLPDTDHLVYELYDLAKCIENSDFSEKFEDAAISKNELYIAMFDSSYCDGYHLSDKHYWHKGKDYSNVTEIDFNRLNYVGLVLFFTYRTYGYYLQPNEGWDSLTISESVIEKLDDFWFSANEDDKVVVPSFAHNETAGLLIEELKYMTNFRDFTVDELRHYFYSSKEVGSLLEAGLDSEILEDVKEKVREKSRLFWGLEYSPINPYIAESLLQGRDDLAADLIDFVIKDFDYAASTFFVYAHITISSLSSGLSWADTLRLEGLD